MAINLPPNRLQPMGHYRTAYDVILPSEVAVNDAFKPEFWAHVGHKLKPLDVLTIFPENLTRMVQCIVLNAGRGFAKIRPFNDVDLTRADEAGTVDEITQEAPLTDLTVKYNGPHDKWCVIRDIDGEKLVKELPTKDAANAWKASHLKALAA